MITVLKNANVYTPAPQGLRDILVAGEKILRVEEHIDEYDNCSDVKIIDLQGRITAPGYIDLHVHVTGGGGEQGPASRVPELGLQELLKSGVTTVLGLLGTDGVTRSLENLLAKVRALQEEGITTFMLTGSYAYPTETLTGSIERDMVLIDKVVGAKVALSDHRDSGVTGQELIRLATQVRRGGMLAGTPGLVVAHMGGNDAALDPIFYALEHSALPAGVFLPTHMGRNEHLLQQGLELIRRGGAIDVTVAENEETAPQRARQIAGLLRRAADPAKIVLSSDGGGSMPRFDDAGNCVGLTYASPRGLHRQIRALVQAGIPLEQALPLLTANPAALLQLQGEKGCIAPGADADLLVLDEMLNIFGVFARGRIALWEKQPVMKGKFE